MSHIETKLRARTRLDVKWLRIELQSVFGSQDLLDALWNSLINDGELSGPFSEGLLNTAGVIARKGEQGKYYCGLKVRNQNNIILKGLSLMLQYSYLINFISYVPILISMKFRC